MEFRYEMLMERPLEEVFAFFCDPGNLARAYEGVSSFRMLRHGGSVEVGKETWVESTMFGLLPVVTGFGHRRFEPPHAFMEAMIHGPFARFDHLHEFEEHPNGTRILDTLQVEIPWFYGGKLAEPFFVTPMLERMLSLREVGIRRLLEGTGKEQG